MKTVSEIKAKIGEHEKFISELTNQKNNTDDVHVRITLSDNIDMHQMKIDQLVWVLDNQNTSEPSVDRPHIEPSEVSEVFDGFLNANGMFWTFKSYAEEMGYTLPELGIEDDE